MYRIGSIEEKVMVKLWLLGLRISDACRLKKISFELTPTEELIEVLIETRKEGIVAHVFLDHELQRLLETYLPTLKKDNPYFFQSSRGAHLTGKQLLRKLQRLQKKAQIKAKGRFGWHIGRKLYMRTSAENGVTSWNAKLMVGKAVDPSIATYINHADLKKQAKKVLNVLKMETTKANGHIESLKEVILQTEKDIHKLNIRLDLQRQFNEQLEKQNNDLNHKIESFTKNTEHEMMTKYKILEEKLESINEYIATELIDSWKEEQYLNFLKTLYPKIYKITMKEYEQAQEKILELIETNKKENSP
jgi:hypothetical protein